MKLNTSKDKYIIIEIIPTAISKEKGQLVQISALKMDGFKVIDRFDYRLNEEKIELKKILEIISYDKNDFNYVDSEEIIWNNFNEWSDNLPILYIDNLYTLNYIDHLNNTKESILNYLDIKYTDDIIDVLIKKYNLEPSNYIVDLLLESLIYHSNKKLL